MTERNTSGVILCVVFLTGASAVIASDEIEVRVYDGTTYGSLYATYDAGSDISIFDADNYIIREANYVNDPQYGIGTIYFSDTRQGSGDFTIRIQKSFESSALPALTTCGGVQDNAHSGWTTRFSATLAGSNDGEGGNGITGDIECDKIDSIRCWGRAAGDITANDKIGTLSFYAIAGGVTIQVVNNGTGDEIQSISVGWATDWNQNTLNYGDSMVFGSEDDPVIVRPGSTGTVGSIVSYTDMYLDYYGGKITEVRTARSSDSPDGLNSWDACFTDLASTQITDVWVPYNDSPCSPDFTDATVTGTLTQRNVNNDYDGELHCNGTFSADFLIKGGLHADGRMFLEPGSSGGRLSGSIIYHWVYGDVGETDPITYNGHVYLGCDSSATELPLENTIGFFDKPDDMGYGTMGEVPFKLNDDGCFPENGYVWDVSDEGDDLDVVYLQFYVPLIGGAGDLVTVKARHYPDIPSNPWVDVTNQCASLIVEGDYPWEQSPSAPKSIVKIIRVTYPSFPTGYEYLIIPNENMIMCDNTKNYEDVADFQYTIYTQE